MDLRTTWTTVVKGDEQQIPRDNQPEYQLRSLAVLEAIRGEFADEEFRVINEFMDPPAAQLRRRQPAKEARPPPLVFRHRPRAPGLAHQAQDQFIHNHFGPASV